jgi:vacuolar-type H+-ATPase subunit F/Vma7
MDDTKSMRVCYIGDALAAAGFALAGARVYSPAAEPDAVWELVLRERAASDLVIVDEALAQGIAVRLEDLLADAPLPPILVMPSLAGDAPYADASMAAARGALGLA